MAKNPTDFSVLLSSYLTDQLPVQRNVSPDTLSSYCDTFRLMLTYFRDERGMKIEKIRIADFTAELIRDFLGWLMNERGCGVSTRNQRLAAIHSFFDYVQAEAPQSLIVCQNILHVPFSKKKKPLVNYLSVDEMQKILAQPNAATKKGRRDLAFLCLLYDTGARVSEIVKIKVRDVRLEHPAKVTLLGKGDKAREVPLLANTSEHLKNYLKERKLNTFDKLDRPLFFNSHGNALTRAGAAYILKKYVASANVDTRVSPHVLRHSKAMHLLESGINIFYIKGILGHEDISTTEVYAKANIETQRKALEKRAEVVLPAAAPSWADDTDTIEWLKNYGRS